MTKRVLFVCYGNACRSVMAEALARHYWGDKLEVASAGLHSLGSFFLFGVVVQGNGDLAAGHGHTLRPRD